MILLFRNSFSFRFFIGFNYGACPYFTEWFCLLPGDPKSWSPIHFDSTVAMIEYPHVSTVLFLSSVLHSIRHWTFSHFELELSSCRFELLDHRTRSHAYISDPQFGCTVLLSSFPLSSSTTLACCSSFLGSQSVGDSWYHCSIFNFVLNFLVFESLQIRAAYGKFIAEIFHFKALLFFDKAHLSWWLSRSNLKKCHFQVFKPRYALPSAIS